MNAAWGTFSIAQALELLRQCEVQVWALTEECGKVCTHLRVRAVTDGMLEDVFMLVHVTL